MEAYIPDFLRTIVSVAMNIVLMLTLMEPKYSKKVIIFVMLGIMFADLSLSFYCYLIYDVTVLGKLELLLFTALCFIIKPFFKDSFVQWLFSFATVQNINFVVVVLSFILSRYLPFSMYANTLIRLILFGLVYLLLKHKLRPLYRQAIENWKNFVYVAILIYFNFAYYFLGSSDITKTLVEEKRTLLLLIILSCGVYISVFHSLKNLDNEYKIKEENIKFKNRQDVMGVSLDRMQERLDLQEKVTSQIRIAQHDHRHFSRMLLELLHNGETQKAIDSLEKQLHVTIKSTKKYCENTVINAAISFYIERCSDYDIQVVQKLDIPYDIPTDSLRLSLVLSNLLENAINACLKLDDEKKYIIFTVAYTHKQLIIEIKNPYDGTIFFDENGYPTSLYEEHGFGTKSIIEFVNTHDGEVLYQTDNNVFVVRIMI